MPTIDANALQELIDQINTLRTEVKTTGDEGRNRLGGINVDGAIDRVPKDAGGKVDAAGWSATSEEKKKEIHQGLVQVRDSLHDAADLDGPAEPGHIMSADYASNAAIITWAVAGFLVTAGLLVGIVLFWGKATGTDFHTKIQAAAVAIDEWDAAQKEATTANEEVARVQLASTGAEEEKDRQEAQKTLGALLQKATAQHERAGKAAQQANLAAVDAVRAIKAGGASEDSVLLMVVLLGAFGGVASSAPVAGQVRRQSPTQTQLAALLSVHAARGGRAGIDRLHDAAHRTSGPLRGIRQRIHQWVCHRESEPDCDLRVCGSLGVVRRNGFQQAQ
jgi:hypothetical protein